MSDRQFNKSRLELARLRRHYTKKALAEAVGLSVRSLTNFESERCDDVPSEQTLTNLAQELNFPVEFFFGEELEVPTADNASFRSFSRLTSAQRNSALAAGAVAFLFNDWLEERFNLPQFSVPDLSGFGPEEAAEILRSEWGIGDRPISNMVHLLESKGVRVFSLIQDTKEVNAFCCWKGGRLPFVFLNTYKSAESSRFDAAHELGHLVLHRHGDNKGKAIEHEANSFASAFLMPSQSVIRNASRVSTVDAIVKAKKYWGVSAMALAYRLNRLNLVSDWVYRSLCVEMSKMNMRVHEPESIERERSQILSKILDILRKREIGVGAISRHLQVSVDDLSSLLFGLATVSISGGSRATAKSSASLQLVK
ncbi:MAG: ImmA/IrrE family metallo-endopeptidase [Marinobacter sp.]|nr:ImmA/IrrE family metallo-endopeptidase [Marinobacter sp.]